MKNTSSKLTEKEALREIMDRWFAARTGSPLGNPTVKSFDFVEQECKSIINQLIKGLDDE